MVCMNVGGVCMYVGGGCMYVGGVCMYVGGGCVHCVASATLSYLQFRKAVSIANQSKWCAVCGMGGTLSCFS